MGLAAASQKSQPAIGDIQPLHRSTARASAPSTYRFTKSRYLVDARARIPQQMRLCVSQAGARSILRGRHHSASPCGGNATRSLDLAARSST